MIISAEQHQLLIGSILGDAHVQYNGKNCRIVFEQSAKQFQYLNWKYSILKPLCTQQGIVRFKVLDKRTNLFYQKVRFRTITHNCFNQYHELFYLDNVKIIQNKLINHLNSELALAVWYLDDGTLRTDCKAFRIHTNSFSLDEIAILQKIVFHNFGIISKIHKQKKSFNLYIGSKNDQSQIFCDIIRSLIVSKIPTMAYKLF